MPAKDGDLYFSAETYIQNIVDQACSGDTFPIVYVRIYQNDPNAAAIKTAYYYDAYAVPLAVAESAYNAGDTFYIKVLYDWKGSVGNDYTVKVYSK